MRVLLIGSEGYAGSLLATELNSKIDIDLYTCDLIENEFSKSNKHIQDDYANLTSRFISQFDSILLFAAHSSVKQAMDNPEDAIKNNLLSQLRLISNMNQRQLLVYASSGSVYDGYSNTFPNEESPISRARNIYDFTKIAGDLMSSTMQKRLVGLRLGTLTGTSPNVRRELVVNKMTLDAFREGEILVSNENSYRSCLDTRDFLDCIASILREDDSIKEFEVFNLASYSLSIGEIASTTADLFNAKLTFLPATPSYDFTMSTNKFESWFRFKFRHDLKSSIKNLSNFYSQK